MLAMTMLCGDASITFPLFEMALPGIQLPELFVFHGLGCILAGLQYHQATLAHVHGNARTGQTR